jgi:hypothetical protein
LKLIATAREFEELSDHFEIQDRVEELRSMDREHHDAEDSREHAAEVRAK